MLWIENSPRERGRWRSGASCFRAWLEDRAPARAEVKLGAMIATLYQTSTTAAGLRALLNAVDFIRDLVLGARLAAAPID